MKQRRVGTFTLGITLILTGIMVPLILTFKEKAIQLLQFAPVVLIFLGVEVLIYAYKFKEDKLKYDGVSIFILILITVLSIGTASVAPIVTRTITCDNILQQQRDKGQDVIEDILYNNELNGRVFIHFDNHNYIYWVSDSKIDDVKTGASIEINDIEQGEISVTKEKIIQKITAVIKDINNSELNLSDVSIWVNTKDDELIASIDLSSGKMKQISNDFVSKKICWSNDFIKDEMESSTTTSSYN